MQEKDPPVILWPFLFKPRVGHLVDEPPPLSTLSDQIQAISEIENDIKSNINEEGCESTGPLRHASVIAHKFTVAPGLKKGFFDTKPAQYKSSNGGKIKVMDSSRISGPVKPFSL